MHMRNSTTFFNVINMYKLNSETRFRHKYVQKKNNNKCIMSIITLKMRRNENNGLRNKMFGVW